MANASFLQSTFLSGVWSPNIQGNMHNQAYKGALNVSENYYPTEEGALTRRQGTRFLGPTRHGKAGRLIAFDFSIVQPYQMEFTDGKLRFYAGYSIVTYTPLNIAAVNRTNPAEIVTSSPHGMSSGADVIFKLNSSPVSIPQLGAQQFTITSTGTNSFTLADAVTGAAIDGTGWNPYLPGNGVDQVAEIFELVTPYTNGSWSSLRAVSNEDNVLLLNSGAAPQVITEGVTPAPFQINAGVFLDGPYEDINSDTTNTVTPSGTSGSVTLTFVHTTNINNGQGFLSTDVGRLIRIQGGPAIWAVGTTYSKGAVVTGSDSNVYQSNVNSNLGNDPTTDGGVNWTLGTTGVTWTWAQITAVTDTKHVTATIKGADLVNTDATPVWRLGLYGDTNGWPTAGVYHEGRLWLTGVKGNRIDSGTANNVDVTTGVGYGAGTYNFAPTGPDGTVADANGITATANATDVNAFFWMASDPEGLILGSQAGEWIVKASQLDDPLTPTSIQMRRFSTYGGANIEPIRANRELIFVQRQKRKLLELGYYPYGEVAGYYAPNMAKFAENLTAPGIAEIRWQSDQTPIVWARTADDDLLGVTYKHAPASGMGTADTFTAWHGPHPFGHGRKVESISTGPNYDGLSMTLYMVTNQTDVNAPDYNVRWVEVLTPQFDDAIPDSVSYFVDGGGNPVAAVETSTGVTIYGFHYSAGQQVSAVIGGLDLGDYTVAADGSITLVFGTPAAFTKAFFEAFETQATNYGLLDTSYSNTVTSAAHTPPYAANSEGAFQDTTSVHVGYQFADIDLKRRLVYGLNTSDSVYAVFNFDTWANTKTDTLTNFLNGLTLTAAAFLANDLDGYLYLTVSTGVAKILPADYSHTVVATTGEGGLAPDVRSFMPLVDGLIATTGVTSVSQVQAITILDSATMTWPSGLHWLVDEDYANLIKGPGTVFYATGTLNTYGSGSTIGLYRGDGSYSASFAKIANIAPSDIDATWTTFSTSAANAVYDAKDGNIILGFKSVAGPTTTAYLVKINPNTGAIVWKLAHPTPGFALPKEPVTTQHIGWFDGENGVRYIDTIAGTSTLETFSTIFLAIGNSYFDPTDGSVTVFDSQASWSVAPTLLGPYSPTHETGGISSGTINKLYFGVDTDAITTTSVFHAPTSTGYTYTSKGQLLRPDFGEDAGARNGPAFGKKRRIHGVSFGFYRTQNIKVGTDFSKMIQWRLTTEGNVAVAAPTLYSGISWDSINDDYGFTSQIAWQQERPYPALIQAIEGYIETQDK